MERVEKKKSKALIVMKALLVSYVLTGILLALLALLLYKTNLDEGKVEAGILLIYILTSFTGGFAAGKMSGNKKFIWGLLVGGGYILLLTLVSLCVNQGINGTMVSYLTTAVMCIGSGMLGGMIS